jgi:DNA-binding MarR family transcriptional regulator
VARQAAALEEGGFISRIPSVEDKRVMGLYPTEKTLALLPEMNAILDQWEDFLAAGLSADELEIAERVLERMKIRAAAWMEEH